MITDVACGCKGTLRFPSFIAAPCKARGKGPPCHPTIAQVAKLREALQQVADVKADVGAHVDALEQAQEELEMDAEPTDFAAVLNDAAAQAAEDHR